MDKCFFLWETLRQSDKGKVSSVITYRLIVVRGLNMLIVSDHLNFGSNILNMSAKRNMLTMNQ